MSNKFARTLALAVTLALLASAGQAQILPPMSAGPPPLTPFPPIAMHITIPQGPNGEFMLGDPVNPLVVSYSPTAGPLEKWLMPTFDQNGDGQIDPGDFFQFISNPILLQEHLIVGPGQPWTDWHERIVGNDWVWTSTQIATPGPPPGPSGLIVQNNGAAVDFFFDPIVPGTPVDITKQLQFVGMPTPAMIADFVDGKFMIRVVEYPTSVPEPGSGLLLICGALALTLCRSQTILLKGRSAKCIALLAALCLSTEIAAGALIATVPIGNAGNLPDSTGFGAVSYDFRIGKFEVTNADYSEFLNLVDPTGTNALHLYSFGTTLNGQDSIDYVPAAVNGSKYVVKPGRNNNPAGNVSWYSAIRFANWLHNGQGSGSTETGAYTLLGGTPVPSNANSITRNPGAIWFLPSEDEWYKAAYYVPTTSSYFDFPTGSNLAPNSDQPPGTGAPNPANTANFFRNDSTLNGYDDGYAVTGSTTFNNVLNYLTDVGAYTFAISPYGTFDQGGNVWEWNESLITTPPGGLTRSLRGGSYLFTDSFLDKYYDANYYPLPADHFSDNGFRVATIPNIPEPSAAALACFGLGWLLVIRSRG